MIPILVALGSNLGDRQRNLQEAVNRLSERLQITSISRIYDTAPMYVTDQPPFLNAALAAETDLPPKAVLQILKTCENMVEPSSRVQNQPRHIDLDLLSYGNLNYTFSEGGSTRLVVPHPRIAERRFVLQPLADLQPAPVIAGFPSLEKMLRATEDQVRDVRLVEHAALSIPGL